MLNKLMKGLRKLGRYLLDRLDETSTWAAFAAACAAGAPFESWLIYPSVICAGLAAIMPDFKKGHTDAE